MVTSALADAMQVVLPDDVLEPFSATVRRARTPEFLVDGLLSLPLGEVSMLYGDSGIGKGWLSYQLAVAAASGRPFLGCDVRQGPVLVLDFENYTEEVGRRLGVCAQYEGLDANSLDGLLYVKSYRYQGKDLFALQQDGALDSMVAQAAPQLIIVDGWQAAFGGNPTDQAHIVACYRVLNSLTKGGRAVLVLHHVSSAQASKKNPDPAGNRYVRHFARAVFSLKASETGKVTLSVPKENYGIEVASAELRPRKLEGGMIFERWAGMTTDVSKASASASMRLASKTIESGEAVVTALRLHGPLAKGGLDRVVAELTGLSPVTARQRMSEAKVLVRLIEQGAIRLMKAQDSRKDVYVLA